MPVFVFRRPFVSGRLKNDELFHETTISYKMTHMEKINGNLILIGLMGAGKTTLGKQLAQMFECPFYDSDYEICTSSGVSIPTIFEMEGEEGFRNRETNMLKKLASRRNIVLSTGGGSVLRSENRQILRQNGTVVYLHASPETLLERTRYDSNRPLMSGFHGFYSLGGLRGAAATSSIMELGVSPLPSVTMIGALGLLLMLASWRHMLPWSNPSEGGPAWPL